MNKYPGDGNPPILIKDPVIPLSLFLTIPIPLSLSPSPSLLSLFIFTLSLFSVLSVGPSLPLDLLIILFNFSLLSTELSPVGGFCICFIHPFISHGALSRPNSFATVPCG